MGVWQLDPMHTQVEFAVKHLGMMTVRGHFTDVRASGDLNVEHFPTVTFKSTKIESAGSDRYTMTGDLTIKGNTRPVSLAVVNYGDFNDPTMGHRIGYGAETQILRKDFGLNVDMLMDGRLVIGSEIQITIQGELVEANVPAAATS